MDKYKALSNHVDKSLHPENVGIRDYFSCKEQWLQKVISPHSLQKDWELVADEEKDFQIFSWPLFTEEFCRQLISESEEEDNWSNSRHEHYPTTDKLLDWLGLNKIYNEILKEFVYPAAKSLYSLEGKSWDNLKFENFIIKYENDRDKQSALKIHHDHSLVTALVTLNERGKDFIGGGNIFSETKNINTQPRGLCYYTSG